MITDAKIKSAKGREKQYKLHDEKGLFLIVRPNGNKWWRFKYRFEGRAKEISLGVYPDVNLSKARARRKEAREDVADDIDPSVKRQANAASKKKSSGNTFEAIAREWLLTKKKPVVVESTYNLIKTRFERDIFPYLGARPIKEITPPELLEALQLVTDRGAVETAHRILNSSDAVFRYAIATSCAVSSPARDLKDALTAKVGGELAAITEPKEIGRLLRAIDSYTGTFITRMALQLAPLVMLRPGELRHAEWSEIDLDNAMWTIPAKKMKKRRDHLVPLSKQAVNILKKILPVTGDYNYVFIGARSHKRPMSENAITAALRKMDYTGDEMTGHGFRTMASTRLNEMTSESKDELPWDADCIEMQLAHVTGSVRSIYNRAKYIKGRTIMLQTWADYLDELRAI